MTENTIDITPTFAATTVMCIALLEGGNEMGKRAAREELLRYARELDRLAATVGTSFDTEDTPVDDGDDECERQSPQSAPAWIDPDRLRKFLYATFARNTPDLHDLVRCSNSKMHRIEKDGVTWFYKTPGMGAGSFVLAAEALHQDNAAYIEEGCGYITVGFK